MSFHGLAGIGAKLLALGRRPVPMTRRQALALLGAGVTAAGAGALWHAYRFELRNEIATRLWLPTPFDGDSELERSRSVADAIRPLFARLARPGPGDWLMHFDEPGQSFNQYLRGLSKEAREATGDIVILPLGKFDTRLSGIISETVRLVELFYQRPVRLLPAEPVPDLKPDQRRMKGGTEQLFALPLLEFLKTRVPSGAAGLLAMTPYDLTANADWNFVFGEADLVDRVGVWSLHRLAAKDAPTEIQLRRVAQVAVHELGHMFGMWHCTAYSCCMNGSNSMRESDAAPLAFCPECDAKVCWRFHLDPAPRYRQLAQFVSLRGLPRDAEMWTRCASAVSQLTRASRLRSMLTHA